MATRQSGPGWIVVRALHPNPAKVLQAAAEKEEHYAFEHLRDNFYVGRYANCSEGNPGVDVYRWMARKLVTFQLFPAYEAEGYNCRDLARQLFPEVSRGWSAHVDDVVSDAIDTLDLRIHIHPDGSLTGMIL